MSLLQAGSSLFVVAAGLAMPPETPPPLVVMTVIAGLVSALYHSQQPSASVRWLGSTWAGSRADAPALVWLQQLDKTLVALSMVLIPITYYEVQHPFEVPGVAVATVAALAAAAAGDRGIAAAGALATLAMTPLLASSGQKCRHRQLFMYLGGALGSFYSITGNHWPHIPRYLWHFCNAGVAYTAAVIIAERVRNPFAPQ